MALAGLLVLGAWVARLELDEAPLHTLWMVKRVYFGDVANAHVKELQDINGREFLMLALLKKRLDAKGWTYEYLDGATTDRQARVERFQGDPACPLFLVSLKAGGLGLNLTAAEYVFLLDPWWNPAVEAQAIDRAHRIGQRLPVFAYRLIAKDTVEERILALQDRKRALSDAIVEGGGATGGVTKEDILELLEG